MAKRKRNENGEASKRKTEKGETSIRSDSIEEEEDDDDNKSIQQIVHMICDNINKRKKIMIIYNIYRNLINIMKYNASSGNNKARFYISKALRTPFSTAILNVSDFNTEMFFNIFERHMQSNAEEILNNGWSSTVSLYIFPNTYTPQSKKKKPRTKSFLYKKFGKNGSEAGKKKGGRYGTVFFKFRHVLKIVVLPLHY